MNMSALQNLLMGFVSGFAEMLPISADAHRLILRTLFGVPKEDALFRLFCHLFVLLTLLWLFQPDIRHLRRTSRLMKIPPKRRRQRLDPASAATVRLLKIATISMVVGKVLFWKLSFIREHLAYMALTLLINGLILLVPGLIRSGNMDSRNMPKMTGMLMGIGGGFAGIPGISHMGSVLSFGVSAGVDRHYALRFAWILLIPGLMVDLVFDLIAVLTGSMAAFSGRGLFFALLGGCFSAYAAFLGTRVMRWIADRRGFDGFAYYCWGAALLSFILFLNV